MFGNNTSSSKNKNVEIETDPTYLPVCHNTFQKGRLDLTDVENMMDETDSVDRYHRNSWLAIQREIIEKESVAAAKNNNNSFSNFMGKLCYCGI